MTEPKIITAAPRLAVSLTEALAHVRESGDVDTPDSPLLLYIDAAENYVKARTGRTFHQTTYEVALPGWPSYDPILVVTGVELPRATPLISIDSVTYKDTSGVTYTLASSEYVADTDNVPGRFVLGYQKSWPTDALFHVNPVKIQYTAGIAITSPATNIEVDADAKLPILLLAAHLYENREAVVISEMGSIQQISISYGVEHYIAKLKVEYAF